MPPARIPLSIKIAHTAYVGVLVPVYFVHYGPGNFLWFSDLAVIGMVPALWGERRLLTSMIALSILLPEIPWNVGYLVRLATGRELFGLSAYMFDRKKPRWLRALSLFHVWLPGLAFWMLRRIGYDPRAFRAQLVAGEAALIASYALTRAEENVNWVYGPGDKPQKRIPRGLYFCAVLVFFPLCLWWPTHRILKRFT
jgi:hypothetical protein